jgi:hypothetical protein
LGPADLKTATLIESSVNLQKTTLRLHREAFATTLKYSLSFKFDTTKPAMVKLYWGCKEHVKEHGLGVEYRDHLKKLVEPWAFGPFPAGLDQSFTLPPDPNFAIDQQLLKRVDLG